MPETVRLTLPAMGESVTEGTVVNWVKHAGDPVSEGETLVEVTTDKVDIEVPAPASGTLVEVTAAEGDTVPVGGTLGLIAPGRRADILVLDSDPSINVWNTRRISTLIVDGNILDREALLKMKK